MKKFFSFLAAAAMLFTASCSNEDLGADEGGEAVVSFSMNLQGASSSKAIGDGTTVNKLVYSVFQIVKDENGVIDESQTKYLTTVDPEGQETFPYTTEIRLAKNKDYRVVFWAQNDDCGAYGLNKETMELTVAYDGFNNDEKRDAFYASKDLKITGSVKEDITLRRPFAQLNVGVTAEDWNAAVTSNATVEQSKVTVKQVASSMNLFSGVIGANDTDVTYEYAAIPKQMLGVDLNGDKDTNDEGEQFHYLSMSYLLVEKNDVQVDFLFKTKSNEIDLSIPTVPVERNHRTNIIGQILTGNVTFEIKIDAGFVNDYNVHPNVVTNAEQLQAAIDAAQPGINTIMFSANIKGDVVIPQTEGTNIVIDGANYKYDGTMNIRGNNRFEGEETLVIKNVNFETETASEDFIWSFSQNAPDRYAHNITIENCTFTATGAAVNSAVGFRIKQAYNIAMNGCTATNMHSMLQSESIGTDVIVDGAIINGEKNGLSFKNIKNAIVTNSDINVAGYGIRFDGTYDGYALNVKDCNVDAYQPVVVRYMTGKDNVYKFEGNNTFTTTEAYQIVITKGDDGAAYEVPTGTYELIGAENFVVYPRDVVTNANELKAALTSGVNTIILANDITLTENWVPVGTEDKPWTGVFNGNGHKISGLTIKDTDYAAFFAYVGENAEIKNVTFENVDIKSNKHAAALVYDVSGNGLTIENVTVSGNIEAANYGAGLVCFADGDAVSITNCTNNANVSASRSAGIIAWIDVNSTIDNCVNNGDITGSISAAGIANRFAGTIKNAVNNGAIVGNGTEAASGIVGTLTGATTFEYCYNYGTVKTTANNANSSAAGILGQCPNTKATVSLTYCANYGNITAEESYAAGIAYSLYGNINANYCYNKGAVYGADGAGAIAPKAQYGANDTAKYCLNAGAITSKGKVYQGSNKNTSCFYYNNSDLLNVSDNAVVNTDNALTVLNGGTDATFFSVEGGVIVVK